MACLLLGRRPVYRRRESDSGFRVELGNLSSRCEGKNPSGDPMEDESTDARHGGGPARSSVEVSVMGTEPRGWIVQRCKMVNRNREEPLSDAKPFGISKRLVWDAYKRVKANRGAAGVDGQSIAEFEKGLENNLYKLWNRMSSGSYFPPPVRRVEIPKRDGRMRPLGIPTVADRIAQTVVKTILEPDLEECFHPDSYGYRPGKSAIDAVGMARKRCWRHDWVLDLDIKGFFDNIDHDLMMRAVRKHTDYTWVLLYIERWLKAPVQTADGDLVASGKGTPQGGVISPLLANLFLHYAFDVWMQRNHPYIPFERYADDVICHCTSERQARWLHKTLQARFLECGLELHPDKTKVVYCKDDDRRGRGAMRSLTFSASRFGPGRRGIGRVSSSSAFCLLPVTSRSAECVARSDHGVWAAVAT